MQWWGSGRRPEGTRPPRISLFSTPVGGFAADRSGKEEFLEGLRPSKPPARQRKSQQKTPLSNCSRTEKPRYHLGWGERPRSAAAADTDHRRGRVPITGDSTGQP